jgi:hypothetical protein
MKKSDLIIKLSSELEKAQVALSSAAEAIEKYEGDNLDDQTLEDAAYAARGRVDCAGLKSKPTNEGGTNNE